MITRNENDSYCIGRDGARKHGNADDSTLSPDEFRHPANRRLMNAVTRREMACLPVRRG
jgi:hypothetical protein